MGISRPCFQLYGLGLLAEARGVMATTEIRFYAAEFARLQGALLLRQAVQDAHQAEVCFQQALAGSRRNPGSYGRP